MKEVACDGILFHNAYWVPVVLMDKKASDDLQNNLLQIKNEIIMDDSSIEEMLRILFKQLIIKYTCFWKKGASWYRWATKAWSRIFKIIPLIGWMALYPISHYGRICNPAYHYSEGAEQTHHPLQQHNPY